MKKADNSLIKLSMVERYHAGKAHSHEILCFKQDGNIWAVEVKADKALTYAVTTVEYRSGVANLRYRPNKAQKMLILSKAIRTEILGTAEWLETENKARPKDTRGDIVEEAARIRWNGTAPAHRAVAFTVCGDFRANGIEYQVKYGADTGAATITTEQTLINLGL